MKTRRKIWSIPIAVLALVLMLVGALAVTGIVQAQSNAVHSVSLTGPDGKAVPLTNVDIDFDEDTLEAGYTFPYDAASTRYTGDFTVAVSAGRAIGTGTPEMMIRGNPMVLMACRLLQPSRRVLI